MVNSEKAKKARRLFNHLFPYLIITCSIILFNWKAVWGLDAILQDDQMFYHYLSLGKYNWSNLRRVLLSPIIMYYILQVFVVSIYWARLLIVLLFMLPGSAMLFYLLRNTFRLPFVVSVSAAILPFILPGQSLIPTYIIGSYSLPSLFFGLLALILGIKYLITQKRQLYYVVASIISYLIAVENTELLAVMVPVFLFTILVYGKFSKKSLYLGSAYALISIIKTIRILNNPWGKMNSVSNNITSEVMLYRLEHSFNFMSPFGISSNNSWYFLAIIALIIIGAYINLRKPDQLFEKQNKLLYPFVSSFKNVLFIYGFVILWFIFAMGPFIFLSHDFTSRYYFFSSVGFNLIICLSIYSIFSQIHIKKINIVSFVFIGLIIFAGVKKYYAFEERFAAKNNGFHNIRSYLSELKLPQNAQVVLASTTRTNYYLGGGIFLKSSGCYKFILKRTDVNGQIMYEYQYYDPFLIKKNVWANRNSQLDIMSPTFLIRTKQFLKDDFFKLEYALQWRDSESKNSAWTIYKFDLLSGNASGFVEGIGWEAYSRTIDSLNSLGITRDMIMFGGLPTSNDSIRLGLNSSTINHTINSK